MAFHDFNMKCHVLRMLIMHLLQQSEWKNSQSNEIAAVIICFLQSFWNLEWSLREKILGFLCTVFFKCHISLNCCSVPCDASTLEEQALEKLHFYLERLLCYILVVLGTRKFQLPSQKNQLEHPPKSDFSLGTWEQLQLPPVMTCKADFTFQYGRSLHQK